MLDEIEIEAHVDGRVLGEHCERVVSGAEAVHEHEWDAAVEALAQAQYLARDQLEEGHTVLRRQQALRAGHAHGCAEAAVQLQHHRAADHLLARVGMALDLVEALERVKRRDVALRDQTGRSRTQRLETLFERPDRQVGQSLSTHLRFEGLEFSSHPVLSPSRLAPSVLSTCSGFG